MVITDVGMLKVTKANQLIELSILEKSQGLKLVDQKIILAIVGQISPDDEAFKDYRISVQGLSQITGIRPKNLYPDLKAACARLMTSLITIKEPENPDGFLMVSWFAHAKYIPDGYVEFSISPLLAPYLLRLKDQFTSYYLDQVIHLNSTYHIRLYELLRQFLNIQNAVEGKVGFREVLLKDLKAYLGIDADKYPRFMDFKRHILNKAQEELARKTDLSFTFETVRKGRCIGAVKFIIRHNPRFEAIVDDSIQEGEHLSVDMRSLPPEIATSIKMFVSDKIPDKQMLQLGLYSDVVLRGALMAYMKVNAPRNPEALFLHIVTATDREYQAVLDKSSTSDFDPRDTSWADKYDFGDWE